MRVNFIILKSSTRNINMLFKLKRININDFNNQVRNIKLFHFLYIIQFLIIIL